MAKLPPLQRLIADDFPDQTGWIGRLLRPVNVFFEQMTSALNRRLTINENFAGAIKEVELDGTYPVKVAWDFREKPISVLVGDIYRTDGASFSLSAAVQVQWTYNTQGQLQIDAVTGGLTIDADNKYKLMLECKTG